MDIVTIALAVFFVLFAFETHKSLQEIKRAVIMIAEQQQHDSKEKK